jgi:septum formation protein
MKPLILASQSPRRKELLEKCGVPFTVEAADLDETLNPELTLEEAVMDLSFRKAKAVLEVHPDAVIIGSDTIVVKDGKILGKPKDRKEAKEMLEMLSGASHQVITGLCILSKEREYRNVSVSDVTFAELTEEEIIDYLESGEADDKAGAYGIQGKAGNFITGIRGDYYAIMGLPVSMIYQELKNLKGR